MESRRGTRGARATVVTLLAVFLALITPVLAPNAVAPSASAHDQLISSTPGNGESLVEAPSEATLTFSGNIIELGTELALVDANTGDFVQFAEPLAVSGGTLTQPLPTLDEGAYALNWRVVSQDGHPISGTVNFGVGVEANLDGAKPGATSTGGDEQEGIPPLLATVAVIGVGAAGIAALTLFVVRMRRGNTPGQDASDRSA